MKRVILLVVMMCFVAGFSCCNEKLASNDTQKEVLCTDERMLLLPVVQNGKYGFINKTGEIVIPPKFDYAKGFSEGLAPVNIGGTLFVFDMTGDPLHRSMSLKSVSGGKWGFIDKRGNMVITPQFDGAGGFKKGLASVNVGATGTSKWSGFVVGGKWGAIDRTGIIVIPARYNYELSFNQGLASFNAGGKQNWSGLIEDGKWGCIDKTGKIVIEPKFDWSFHFVDGLASVSVDGHFVSTTLPGTDKSVKFPKDGKWGFVNTSGKYVIQPSYQKAGNFFEGLAAVKFEGKFGYIDKAGTFVIPPQYNLASRFSEGLAYVSSSDKNGFINKKGEFVIKLENQKGTPIIENDELFFKNRKMQIALNFVDGLAIVKESTDKYIRCGVIDKKGKYVIPLEPRNIVYYRKGIFFVITKGSKTGYMDRAGNYIWKPTE